LIDALSIALDKQMENLADLLKMSLSAIGNYVVVEAMQSHHELNKNEKLDLLNSSDEAFDLSAGNQKKIHSLRLRMMNAWQGFQ
jgi:hypothetical protein